MNDRVCYVTSDLHMGDGGPLDDFVDDRLFADWLGGMAASETTLVLNGDVVDFAQIPPYRPDDATPSHLLWTESWSLAKLQAAIDAHPVFFDALADFHRRGGATRVTVGNHDLDFAWPGVHRRWRERVGATDNGATFEPLATSFADVWIQHGHQHTAENRTRHDSEFTHLGPGGERFLERVWGTDFVVTFFNDMHEELPFAQNIKPTWQLLVQGLKQRWLGWRHFVRAVAFVARAGFPVDVISEVVLSGGPGPGVVDLDRLDDHVLDPETALVVRDAIAQMGASEARRDGGSLLDVSLVDALRRGGAVAIPLDDPLPATSETTTLGLFRDDRIVRGARSHIGREFRHVVLGHTHHVVDGQDLGNGSLYFNPGTWIPFIDVNASNVAKVIAEHGISKSLLTDESYYRTEICAVEIAAGATAPRLIRLTG